MSFGNGYTDGRAADVWSLATTLYTVVMASLPWNMAVPSDPFYAEYLYRRGHGDIGAVFGHDIYAQSRFTRHFGELMDRYIIIGFC